MGWVGARVGGWAGEGGWVAAGRVLGHVFSGRDSGRCVFGHVSLHLFCTFFPEGAFLGTFFFTFSARFFRKVRFWSRFSSPFLHVFWHVAS